MDFWLPHRTLGEIYDSRKLADDAMREYKIAARLNPDDADTLYALGKLRYRARLFPDAFKSFDACVKLRPDFTSAHFNKAIDSRSARRRLQSDRRLQVRHRHEEGFP